MAQLHHCLEHAQEIQHPTLQTTCVTVFNPALLIIAGNGYKVCFNGWMVKKNVVDIHIEMLLIFKEKWNKIFRWMNGPRKILLGKLLHPQKNKQSFTYSLSSAHLAVNPQMWVSNMEKRQNPGNLKGLLEQWDKWDWWYER